MQASHLNKIIFSCILYLGIWQNANCQIDTKQISKADSLFKTNQLLEAEKIYLQFYNPRYKEIENIKRHPSHIEAEINYDKWISYKIFNVDKFYFRKKITNNKIYRFLKPFGKILKFVYKSFS